MSTKLRQGFKKKEYSPEWSIDKDYLYWKNPPKEKISLADIKTMHFREYERAKNAPSFKPKISSRLKDIFLNPEKLSKRYDDLREARKQLIEELSALEPDYYFQLAPAVLKNYKWSDSEKLRFIAVKYRNLSAFTYGKEAQKWLQQAIWSEKSPRKRILDYFDYIRTHDLHNDDDILQDEREFKNFKSTIKIYRGFNVPMNSIIRSGQINQLWMRQQTGKSVYFSTSIDIAEKFACTQKLYHILNFRSGLNLSSEEKSILRGRLCIAQYRVKMDDIALFHDATALKEKEIIATPEKVELVKYHFLGFDDFIRVLKDQDVIV